MKKKFCNANRYAVLLVFGIFLAGFLQKRKKKSSLQRAMIQESYQALEQNVNRTNAIGHEVKNQIMVMSLLYQEKDYERLGKYLQKLSQMSSEIRRLQFCKHPLTNMILRGYSARMEKADIDFQVQAALPEQVGIEEEDLTSFLVNLLNNALEGSNKSSASQKRYVKLRLHLQEGYFVISCENSYSGKIQERKNGKIKSSKKDKLSHGYGIRRMEQIAGKYHSILDITYTDKIFYVRTALKMIQIPDKIAL